MTDETPALDFGVNVAQEVERTDWALRSGLQAGLNAGRMEEVEAEEGCHFLTLRDIVVADRTLPALAVVGRLS